MTSHGIVLPTRGVVLTNGEGSSQEAAIQTSIIDLVRDAETAACIDSIWVGDSVLAKPRLASLPTLAAAATITDNITLGTAVYLPQFRHPLSTAHQLATIDLLSEGRLSIGIGVGGGSSVRREHEQFNLPFNHRGAIVDESLDIIASLFRGQAMSYEGEFFTISGADIGLRPTSEFKPLIASTKVDPNEGFLPPIRKRIMRHGGGWMPISIEPDIYSVGIEKIHLILDEAGREHENFDAAYYQDIVISETRAKAVDEARSFLEQYYPTASFTDDQIQARGAFGPPALIQEHMQKYEEAGVDTFVTRFPTSDQKIQFQRFSELL